MNTPRWYPTATLLRDRVLVSAGTKYDHLWYYGGQRDTASPRVLAGGHNIERMGRVDGGSWDPSLATVSGAAGEMPIPRKGHSLVTLTDNTIAAPVLFGGTDSVGALVANVSGYVWTLVRQIGGEGDPDYRYEWRKLTLASGSPFPVNRTEHTAVAASPSEMLVFGGTNVTGEEFWRFHKDAGGAWRWDHVDIDSGSPPPARFGHAAVYDEHDYGSGMVRRMIVYGGASTLGGTPTDNKLYIFTFSGSGFASGSWSSVTVANGPPALYDHTMTLTPHPWGTDGKRIAWVYGGGTSSVLWQLVLGSSSPTDLSWSSFTPGGTSPGARAGHTMYFDPISSKLSLFGGSTDKHVYQISNQLPSGQSTPAWEQGNEAPIPLTGHAVCFDLNGYIPVARIPEIYNPVDDSWTPQPSAARPEQYYPQQFLVPRAPFRADTCRVVVVTGEDLKARYLDVSNSGQAGTWNFFTGAQQSFSPSSSVMYRPGRLLAAGGLAYSPSSGTTVSASAATLDAAAIPSGGGWQQTAGMAYERYFHNLVVLPNGRVLAVGGMTGFSGDGSVWNPANARFTSEWWNPNTGTWQSLAQQSTVVRNYHSTAILLPDGRVLSGGGWWYDGNNHNGNNYNLNMKRLQVFCPPYLFNSSGGLAVRPQVAQAPDSISWGQVFWVCVADTANISSACLVRPAATTHGFDMSQRFVPLTIRGRAGSGTTSDPKRLYLATPASRDSVPSGDYMLFLLGSAEGPDVPSIARWVYVRDGGTDWCDVIAPNTITSLAPDIVGPNEVWFSWTATANDGSITASGPAQSFDLRASTAALNASNWASAIHSTDESVPGEAGTWGSGHVSGLLACTSYYFCVRARDYHSQDGGFQSVSVQTSCGGAGGGYSAHQLGPGSEGAAAAGAERTPPAPGLLVVATHPGADGAWHIALKLQSTPAGSTPATITVETGGAGGAADTLGQFEPDSSDHVLGLCALRARGRLGIPGVYAIERVEPHLRSRSGDLVLAAATHSRLGTLSEGFIASGGPLEIAPDDSLDLTYVPTSAPSLAAQSWYAVVRRTSDAPSIPMSAQRRSLGERPPACFALHQNRPNPFRGTTVIPFDLASESRVSLEVYDVLGRRVATLVSGTMPAGSHSAEWNLRDPSGVRVAAGVYTYRLVAGSFHERRKMTVLP